LHAGRPDRRASTVVPSVPRALSRLVTRQF